MIEFNYIILIKFKKFSDFIFLRLEKKISRYDIIIEYNIEISET